MKIVVTDENCYTLDTVDSAQQRCLNPQDIREFQRKRIDIIRKQMGKRKWDREAYKVACDVVNSKRLSILEV